jgi:translation initiation factor IF-2
MAEKKEEWRLSKITRELNVGMQTVIDFLKKKGFTVEHNPNTKVSQECYDLLLKEYSSDFNAKKESEKIAQKKIKEKRAFVTIDDIEHEDTEDAGPAENVVLVKDFSAGLKNERSTPKPVEFVDRPKIEKPEIKVLGKIDVTGTNKPKPEPEHKEIEEIPSVVAQQSVKQEVVEDEKDFGDDIEFDDDADYEDVDGDDYSDDEDSDDDYVEDEDTDEQSKIAPNIETFATTTIREADLEVKVVGKIDLNALNQKTRPAKKTRKQKEDERRKKEKERRDLQIRPRLILPGAENQAGTVPVQPERPVDEDGVFRMEREKLSGPTVVGKINLEDLDKKKPVASSSEKKKKKKKRKRIQKDGQPGDQPNTQNQQGQQGGQHGQGQHTIRTHAGQQGQPQGQAGAGQPAKPGEVRGKVATGKLLKRTKKLIKKEVNDEDVDKQIKETLARLTANKHKTKTSKHKKLKRELINKRQQEEHDKHELEKQILKVTEFVTVNELASLMEVGITNVIKTCMDLGYFVSMNQRLDAETISFLAEEYGYKVEFTTAEVHESIDEEEEENEEDVVTRAPIVTVMGHVDHGKTSLLDHIRKSNVIATEAGGITQHIGAYKVDVGNGRTITFLDTPGHQAFTAMRARGAKVTDIAIIVVAADDSVMPQTIEAINHAQAASVPIIFAINKIDKPGANPEKIKEQLAKMNLLVEDWGGKIQSQDISAKKGQFIDQLMEKVILEADMLELKANSKKRGVGSVIESSLDKGRGYVVTLLVHAGQVKVGDVILAGTCTGKVKAMYNQNNQKVKVAGPSDPILVLGLNGAPQAGDKFNVMKDEREAREIANKREQLSREVGLRAQKHITLDEIGRRIAIGGFKELNLIVKGDVDGSVEALSDSLLKLSTDKIQVNVIHKAVGQISESDIMLATASNAIIIGFQVRPSVSARRLAESEGIDIRLYSIIYDAINDVKAAMEGLLSPEIKEEIVATIEVREVFKITKVGTVAGCMVRDGKVTRNTKVRLIRDGIVVYTGELGSLKRFKDDVKEVLSGYECGLNISRFNDIKTGDIIEGFVETEVKATL